MRPIISCTAGLAWLVLPVLVEACCMLPMNYAGSISQDGQEAVLIHDGDREELILRIDYKITGKKMPDQFAWVVTVPSEPDHYQLADPELFKEMNAFSQRELAPRAAAPIIPLGCAASLSVDSAMIDSVKLGKRVQVGPYDIQPVQGVGPRALEGLNAWLKEKGFPTEDPKHMAWFIKNRFTFLCVRLQAAEGEQSVGSGGKVKPLHLSFQSERPYYPLLFSSRQGTFDLNLFVLSQEKLDYKKSQPALNKIRWSNAGYRRNMSLKRDEMPDQLQTVLDKSGFKGKTGKWKVNHLRCWNVNHKDAISRWKEDVFLTTKTGGGWFE